MDFIEVIIYTTSFGIEVITGLLLENGINGVVIEDLEDMRSFIDNNLKNWDYVEEELFNSVKSEINVKFYISASGAGFEILNSIKNSISILKNSDLGIELGSLNIETTNVNDADWKDNWKQHYKPIEVGKNIVIKPDWEEYETTGKTVFTINPGHLFGTGLHQTTRLCVEAIERYTTKESEVLDLGCGTGILSIISLMLGANSAVAIDIEPDAPKVAYENACKNGITRDAFTVFSGNFLTDYEIYSKLKSKKYNLIIANIVADVIISSLPFVNDAIDKNGIFITSGIIDIRVDEVKNCLASSGFKVLEILEKDGWYLIASQKCESLHGGV